MTRRRVRARKSRSSDSSLRGGLPLARVRLRRIGLSWTEPLCVSANRLRSLAQELRSSSPGALGKGARRHEVCRRRYHCPVPGCPLNRSRRCTRFRVPPSASLCSRSCGCHFPLRRCAPGARLVGARGPRHIKQGQPSSCKPTHAASRSHGCKPLTHEAESESAARVCRDGLKAVKPYCSRARRSGPGDPL